MLSRCQRSCRAPVRLSRTVATVHLNTPEGSKGSTFVSTLDPKRLVSSDFIDLAGLRSKSFIVAPPSQPRSSRLPRLTRVSSVEIHFIGDGTPVAHRPFPAEAQGFFYVHRPPQVPPIAGTLRFRVTRDPDPSSFESGYDLIGNDHLPWNRPLPSIVRGEHPILAHQLLADQLVDEETLVEASKIPVNARSVLVSSVYEPFPLSFHHRGSKIWVPTKLGSLAPVFFKGMFEERRGEKVTIPYMGEYMFVGPPGHSAKSGMNYQGHVTSVFTTRIAHADRLPWLCA